MPKEIVCLSMAINAQLLQHVRTAKEALKCKFSWVHGVGVLHRIWPFVGISLIIIRKSATWHRLLSALRRKHAVSIASHFQKKVGEEVIWNIAW